ncbi:MAG TPA: hypothetical protein DEB31_08475, partial [Clostridiales bacterium]|nr:hypothetical protein [Clostridiales bacterium]
MRIQNNIMAMNTHRQYTLQNEKVAGSAEKLSSGYRINRAADDAAGLAISEKMRSQIRGLNMAARNTQDAASLIQTAEGALQEVHSMLQRMNELADQSATGTVGNFDRTQIAKEFDQLKREINDIAEQTTFNNMKILDGSLSVKGFDRSATTVGLFATSLGTLPEENAVTQTVPTIPNVAAAYEHVSGLKFVDVEVGDAANDGGKFAKVTIEITPGVSITSGELQIPATDGIIQETALADAFNGVMFTHDGTRFKITKDSGVAGGFYITALTANPVTPQIKNATMFGHNNFTNVTLAGTKVPLEESGLLAGEPSIINGGSLTNPPSTANMPAGSIDPAYTYNTGSAGKRQADIAIDPAKLRINDRLVIGDRTYQLVNTLSEVTEDGVYGIVWTDEAETADAVSGTVSQTGRSMATLINSLATGIGPTGATVAAIPAGGSVPAGGGIRITQNLPDSDSSISFSHQSRGTQGTRIEFDITKLKDGDKIDVTVAGQPYSAVYREGDSVTDIFNNLGVVASGTTETIYPKDNSILFKELNATAEFTGVTVSTVEYGTMRIQVGALEGEQLNIEVQSMNTKGLGLDPFNIDTQDEAGKAITAVRSAIDVVSDQRALLGAMQNRMTYKINNIKVS